ncbi:type I glyceraldehyde-3-phosphate dehydrogenase [Streptomyces sp. 11x1]|uniref:type I glyceraldehyde-3-phosphate dehydrogenase n=1 Tax=Streptomyces sp. 11x1 TaxID=3038642 RepID=UPI002930B00A|nr:type I glyceraldehyde-3-phosphate dehydrogenase [Streptomyces sp. 11x1]WNZ06634.1 type I glyceraldehyde-3-phosphate dehydrogenase [Streptomyces sp. 11x1]
MTVRVGVNGFGRIGRTYLRAALARAEAGTQDVEVVAINDITSPATLAHLLEYDSTFGRMGREVSHDDSSITVDGRRITVTAERDPAALRWADHGADIVVESTGRFRDRESAALHLKAGAHTVLLSAPGKGVDATIVMGVNDGTYDRHRDRIGPHKDLRRARSAALSIIPTSTGAARAVGLVVPELAGALDGIAVRVPVEDGSLTDLAVVLEREATAEEVNAAFTTAADGPLHGVLRVSKAPIVSRDVIGDPSSCVFDPALTQVNGTLAKVFGWYDNEWGYTNRLLDLTALVADD